MNWLLPSSVYVSCWKSTSRPLHVDHEPRSWPSMVTWNRAARPRGGFAPGGTVTPSFRFPRASHESLVGQLELLHRDFGAGRVEPWAAVLGGEHVLEGPLLNLLSVRVEKRDRRGLRRGRRTCLLRQPF